MYSPALRSAEHLCDKRSIHQTIGFLVFGQGYKCHLDRCPGGAGEGKPVAGWGYWFFSPDPPLPAPSQGGGLVGRKKQHLKISLRCISSHAPITFSAPLHPSNYHVSTTRQLRGLGPRFGFAFSICRELSPLRSMASFPLHDKPKAAPVNNLAIRTDGKVLFSFLTNTQSR